MIAQQNRYEELVELLTTYNKHYYTLDNPLVSDKEYDKLYDELVALETEHPEWMRSDSPTQRVGGEVLDKFEKKEHTTQLYSLDKAQSFDELLKFDTDVKKVVKNPQYTVEQKMDGLAFVTSHKHLFEESRTRGTGKIGEIVSNQIKTIKSIPLRISYEQKVEAQGEVFMPRSKFNEYNNKLLEAFHQEVSSLGTDIKEEDMKRLQNKYAPLKNPRNGAAGALRNLDPKVTASRPLDAFVYNVPYIEGKEFATQAEMMDFLKEQGFKVNPYFHVCDSMEEVIELIKNMEDKRDDLDWDIDGMVIKVNDLKQRDLLGYTSKFPKWAIAYKFEAIEETTILRDVSFQVGRTGKITPLAHLDAVEIGGATITKATLNNMDDIHRKGVKIGAEVFVRRSNDVIPEIMGIVDGSTGTDIIAPTDCPECNGKLENDGVHLFCKNSSECPAQQIGRIVHFGSREAMNIDTFSEKTAEQLWEAGLLRSLTDLYQLDKEEMVKLERFGKRKAEKLLDAIEASKTRPLDAFLYGLGIRHAGKGTVERLLRYYNTLEEIADASLEQLCEIEDIGDVVAESIYNFFRNDKNKQMIQELKGLGLEMKKAAPIQTSSTKFEDMVFVITGTLSQSRKHFENIIKDNGGKISGSVTKKTNYVLVGEDAGSKEEKAKKLGIPTLSEDAFNELINS